MSRTGTPASQAKPGRLAAVAARADKLVTRLPTGGTMVGLVFFALSLTPSLLPRNYVLQGILSGCVFAAGYGIGVFLEWIWTFLELKLPGRRVRYWAKRLALLACAGLAIGFLWQSTTWQNSIRAVMAIPPVETRQPVWVAAIAVVPAGVLIAIGTAIVHGVRMLARILRRHIPRRVALLGSMLLVGVISSAFINGVVLRWALAAADQFYAELDALAGQEQPLPADPLASGSAQSLVPWRTIGRDARVYVTTGPTPAEITAITGKPAIAPLRTYVGLRSADSVEERAQLALQEMQRIGAFERSILVLIMPVGTGWVDPPAIDTLEMLHGGDVASVALQYSYLTSWLSLLVEPDVGTAAAQALFSTVYQYWTGLPHDTRPRLYLHGLSLGAYASQASASLYNVLGDPFHGALWAGPPFASPTWRSTTANRQPGTPPWLPRFEDSAIVRFTNQDNALGLDGAPWGPVRLVYLQYPSDPIVFFETAALYRRPGWLAGERPRDISPLLHWYPVVTFFQLLLDMALSNESPIGYGHVYAPQDYLEAWVAVTQPPGWTEQDLQTLMAKISRSGDRRLIEANWFRR